MNQPITPLRSLTTETMHDLGVSFGLIVSATLFMLKKVV